MNQKSGTLPLSAVQKRELARRLLRERELARSASPAASADLAAEQSVSALPPSHFSFDHHPQWLALLAKKDAGEAYFHLHDGIAGATTRIRGRTYINFGNYNYLGLSGHPAVAAAIKSAVERYGSSVSASRMVGGERPLHRDLDRALADLLDCEDCLTFASGYGTNVAALGYLFGARDLILYDALIHNSVVAGATLSGARRISFRHNDWQAVDDLLTRHRLEYERVVIVLEGVYSMDGDYPDLPRFVEIRNRHKTFLMVDEAHSLGVMGARGFGIREQFGLAGRDVDIWMGTLSKSLASCGGYVAGCRSLVQSLRYGAPGFIFSAGLTPANAAAALAALTVMRDEPARVQRLQQNGRLFIENARKSGLDIGNASGLAVLPVIVGSSSTSLALAGRLFDRGINVRPVLHPAVDERSARLRFFVTAEHTGDEIRDTIRATAEEYHELVSSYTAAPSTGASSFS